MDKLAEHINQLAADDEAKKLTEQQGQEAMERSRVGIEFERVERLLANPDVQWWLGQLASLVEEEKAQALSLKISEVDARNHAHRYEFGAAISGDASRRIPNDLERRKAVLTTALKSYATKA